MTPAGPQAKFAEFEVPTLPGVVARLVRAYAGEEPTIPELVRLVQGDPAIASRLLRLANSAYFGFPRQVASVERAVWLLGGATVTAVALGTAILRHWREALPAEAETLWRDAYRAALGCRYLGRRLPPSRWRSPPDALFVAGLLHDLGMILFLARDPELYLRLLTTAGTTAELLEAEREHLGQDHAALGGDALDSWGLPVDMAAVCRHHHSGGLRAELVPDWEVVCAVDVALSGEPAGEPLSCLGEGLVEDLARYLDEVRPEADAFFRAVT